VQSCKVAELQSAKLQNAKLQGRRVALLQGDGAWRVSIAARSVTLEIYLARS